MYKPKLIKLCDGCPGCGQRWDDKRSGGTKGRWEGQCSRCKRCHECCGYANVEFSCEDRAAKKSPEQRWRSGKAYERYIENENILPATRRIGSNY